MTLDMYWELKWNLYVDQEQLIRASICEIIEIWFWKLARFSGLKKPVFTICTKLFKTRGC